MGKQSFRKSVKKWVAVTSFSEATKIEDRFIYELEQYLATNKIEFLRLEYEKKYRAIVLSLADLAISSKQNAKDLVIEGISKIQNEATDQIFFYSAIDDHSILSKLFVNQIFQPQQNKTSLWVGIHQSTPMARPPNHLYQSFGINESEGTLKIRKSTGTMMVFDLFRVLLTKDFLKKSLSKGGSRKIPETENNLRRREEWFRRRFGRND